MFLNINIFPANVLQKHKYINLHYNISIWNICFYDSLHQSTFLNFQTFAVPCMIEITYKTETLLFLYWFWLYTRLFVYNLKLIIELKIWRTYIDKYLVILFAQFFRSVKMSVSRVWGCSMRAFIAIWNTEKKLAWLCTWNSRLLPRSVLFTAMDFTMSWSPMCGVELTPPVTFLC